MLVAFAFSVFALTGLPFPIPAATAKPVSCAIPRPCAVLTNTSSGPALSATSDGGVGALGTSASGSYLGAGVDGESSNQNGMDAGGTFGAGNATGANPFYGVLGYGTGQGVYGETEATGTSGGAAGSGLFGYDAGGRTQLDDFNAGVIGQSGYGSGVIGLSGGSPQSGLWGYIPIGVYGVGYQSGGGGVGVLGEGNDAGVYAENDSANSIAELANPSYLLFAYNFAGPYFYVTNAGNGYISGTLETTKGTYVRARGASGVTRRAFSDETTAPQIEDIGEATLTNGRADVAIDPALGDTIDMRYGYHVFVTPEGDSKGLYVAEKTRAGFRVRESQGGRSSLAFEYRIVAKPLHADDARLAVAPALPPLTGAAASGKRATRNAAPAFLTPEARLRARLGPAGYARAMLAHRER